ncbi:MAG: hypothetical protein M3O31_10920, partial [Acidobacteriota bacterium]|nr:hypothetical protein [Acidobacteriota bacterium]
MGLGEGLKVNGWWRNGARVGDGAGGFGVLRLRATRFAQDDDLGVGSGSGTVAVRPSGAMSRFCSGSRLQPS